MLGFVAEAADEKFDEFEDAQTFDLQESLQQNLQEADDVLDIVAEAEAELFSPARSCRCRPSRSRACRFRLRGWDQQSTATPLRTSWTWRPSSWCSSAGSRKAIALITE